MVPDYYLHLTVYATAKLINTVFIELYFRDLSVSPTVLSHFLAHAPVAEKPRFEEKIKFAFATAY